MKPAAISTIGLDWLLTNYGSFFQHYALRQILKRLGFAPFRVAFQAEKMRFGQRLFNGAMDFARLCKWRLNDTENNRRLRLRLSCQHKIVRLFSRDYQQLVGPLHETQLVSDDMIGVRGGDQVLCSYPEDQWLGVVKKGSPRITYAVSTDWTRNGQDPLWRTYIKEHLAGFTALGIRECCGVDLVKELAPADVPVSHVADPVQLLEPGEWRAIQSERPVLPGSTLLCYLINIRTEEDLRITEYERLAADLQCDLRFVGVQGCEMFVPGKYHVLYSPRQFLRALDDCKYFITNSFHGSVLAIQYEKNFLSVWQNCPPGTNQNERQKELMSMFGLEGRWMDNRLAIEKWKSSLAQPIKWSRIKSQEQTWRGQSLGWLRSNICG